MPQGDLSDEEAKQVRFSLFLTGDVHRADIDQESQSLDVDWRMELFQS